MIKRLYRMYRLRRLRALREEKQFVREAVQKRENLEKMAVELATREKGRTIITGPVSESLESGYPFYENEDSMGSKTPDSEPPFSIDFSDKVGSESGTLLILRYKGEIVYKKVNNRLETYARDKKEWQEALKKEYERIFGKK